MNNLLCLQQIFQTGNLDSISILRQYKLDLMTRFIEKKNHESKINTRSNSKRVRLFK